MCLKLIGSLLGDMETNWVLFSATTSCIVPRPLILVPWLLKLYAMGRAPAYLPLEVFRAEILPLKVH